MPVDRNKVDDSEHCPACGWTIVIALAMIDGKPGRRCPHCGNVWAKEDVSIDADATEPKRA
jgi:ribosomal protein S27AE